MITNRAIASRFGAGASVSQIASTLGGQYTWEKHDAQWTKRVMASTEYVEHAIREVMKRQHRRPVRQR